MASYIGIDLGTTYSAVAYVDQNGIPKIIENEGKNITASCVMLENDSLIVGSIPESRYGCKGFEVGARFKREMGEESNTKLGLQSFSPTDLSTAVLEKMRKVAEHEIGEVAEAVITIPANYMQEARDATMVAAKKAGLNVKYIINEPTAAALYYGYKEGSSLAGNYIIYDLGGGTFDVSVVRVDGESVEVIATEGISKLGGDDFDRALREIVKSKFSEITGNEVSDLELPLSEMVKLKIQLSSANKKPIIVEGEMIEISRGEFEDSISALILQTELLCENVLEEANMSTGDISAVFLAGGSTRIPLVQKSIKNIFKKEPIASANVDEVVALGAALYAAMKSSGEHLNATQSASMQKLKVSEISTYYFGTLSINFNQARDSQEMQNTVIINKGEKIPCSKTKMFTTVHDNQTAIKCVVTKSGSPETDPRFVNTVWEGQLDIPDGRPAGQKIEVKYSFDDNGMMQCEFLDVESNRKTEIDLDSISGESAPSNIDKFLVD